MAALFVISCVAFNAVHQTASRLTWSFARDEALFYSRNLSSIHSSLSIPLYALILNGVCVFLVGIVYLCSSTGMVLLTYVDINTS
jgi:choline transport protein